MPDTTTTITVLRSGLTVPHDSYSGRVAYAGETIELTPEQIEHTRDRNGVSWLDLSPEQQEALGFKLGAGDPDAVIGSDDIGLQSARREKAMEEAKRIPNDAERAAAIQAVYKKYGAPVTQWNLGTYGEI